RCGVAMLLFLLDGVAQQLSVIATRIVADPGGLVMHAVVLATVRVAASLGLVHFGGQDCSTVTGVEWQETAGVRLELESCSDAETTSRSHTRMGREQRSICPAPTPLSRHRAVEPAQAT